MDNALVTPLTIALVAAIAVAVWLYLQLCGTRKLLRGFDLEYDRTVQEHLAQHGTGRSPDELKERLEHLRIRALSADERARFAERWRSAQAQFVGDPKGATRAASELVGEVMQARGYPVEDFELRAADVTVDHPRIVEHFRAAHAIARRNAWRNDHRDANAEDLRQAFVDYRALFDDLLFDDLRDAEPSAPVVSR